MSFVALLDQHFDQLHRDALRLLAQLPTTDLYRTLPGTPDSLISFSVGEQLLRSVAVVEQTFGGLTVSLWDDPFEWTLPEALDTPAKMREYMDEAEAMRQRGFALLHTDADLEREIMAPSGAVGVGSLILRTLRQASEHYGSALTVFRLLGSRPSSSPSFSPDTTL